MDICLESFSVINEEEQKKKENIFNKIITALKEIISKIENKIMEISDKKLIELEICIQECESKYPNEYKDMLNNTKITVSRPDNDEINKWAETLINLGLADESRGVTGLCQLMLNNISNEEMHKKVEQHIMEINRTILAFNTRNKRVITAKEYADTRYSGNTIMTNAYKNGLSFNKWIKENKLSIKNVNKLRNEVIKSNNKGTEKFSDSECTICVYATKLCAACIGEDINYLLTYKNFVLKVGPLCKKILDSKK